MYHDKSAQEVLQTLGVTSEAGLSTGEAQSRLGQYGANRLEEKKGKSRLQMFLSQLNDPMIYILFAAAAVSCFLREFSDAVIILFVVMLNAVVGMVQEGKAQDALDALKKLSSPSALVRREGVLCEIPAEQLVPGDIVVLEAGRVVPCDLRLVTAINLKVEESALTGESVPVTKEADTVVAENAGLGDRVNMAFSSTSVTYGRGEGVCVATGMNTEIGRIASMLGGAPDEMTPLQKRLADLGKVLGILAVGICAALFVLAVVQDRPVTEMLLTAISLAVAAIPEGLPAVVTIVLALGVGRMVKVNTIVRRLPAVETLGAVSIVCSDKTGTLTQNKMTVTRIYYNGKIDAANAMAPDQDDAFLQGFILCNDASTKGGNRVGDPTELALLDMGERFNLTREGIEECMPRINEQAFDSGRKMMTTVHRDEQRGRVVAFTKGAVDVMLPRCTGILLNGETRPITEQDKKDIMAASNSMASDALRVLALAQKLGDDSATEKDLTFVGLVGMIDPPRLEARDAVESFKHAGIRTVMITGDHRDTAYAIAHELGIADAPEQCMSGGELDKMSVEELAKVIDNVRVFARVSPEHKVMIVSALRSKGYIVSMTGDGVNDAPSLKAADIGVAMGITGTDVAKGAADMVLTDDNFATIEKAAREGRNIYQNIKKSVLFLLSSNFGEVLTMFVSIAAGLAAPLKAIHILWINLITDSLPGLALGVDSGDPNCMKVPPRDPKESLFAHGGIFITAFYGIAIGCLTLGAFLWAPLQAIAQGGQSLSLSAIRAALENPALLMRAQTYAFTVLGISQLFHAIGMRNVKRSIFRMNHLENRVMILAVVFGFALQIAVTEIHFLTQVFGTIELTLREWGVLTLVAMIPLALHEILAPVLRRK